MREDDGVMIRGLPRKMGQDWVNIKPNMVNKHPVRSGRDILSTLAIVSPGEGVSIEANVSKTC